MVRKLKKQSNLSKRTKIRKKLISKSKNNKSLIKIKPMKNLKK
jgi:hypothetical protein